MNEKNKVEAILFSTGRRMTVDEISSLTGIEDKDLIKRILLELKADYEQRGTSLTLKEEAGGWKLTVKDHYAYIAEKLITKAELDKPLLETLAVIAWRYPVLQSDVIKIRHNKAYDHIKQLEELGFIKRVKHGRTKKIILTDHFFEYFDLPSKEQREALKRVVPQHIREKIEAQEREIEQAEKKLEEIRKEKENKTSPTNEKP
ncbi:MAG TPA: SMC-Scp complex subunit ScpB [Candidatus Woesearchaeota archaeon]|nr:SMC-Scp complex subunit ScpB [Candidatus Woesearchaeota archaeon]